VTSHGANDPDPTRSRLHREFDWTGTDDPSALLAIPAALGFVGSLHPDGWPGVMAAGHGRAVAVRDALCQVLAVPPSGPDAMLGAMASVPVPGLRGSDRVLVDAIRVDIRDEDGVEVALADWPVAAARETADPPVQWLVRASAAPYVTDADVDRLITAVDRRLGRRPAGS
jgi:isopenicillin-N epimerase